MKIAGLTIAKNCIKYKYPLAEMITQHKDLFDVHFIGIPHETQDTDKTKQWIFNTCENLSLPICYEINKSIGTKIVLFRLDWPNEDVAWSEESLDKKLQQKMLDNIDWSEFDWLVKIDADEFIHEADFDELKSLMEVFLDTESNAIAMNYKQYMGSLNYTVWDPTNYVCHIFKPGQAKFAGNDAMQFKVTEGNTVYLEDIYLHHIGYVKDPNLITTRIREHLVLNESMYPSAVHNADKWKDYKFEFPAHKKGAKLWPIGISDALNETEYTAVNINTVPQVLRNNQQEFHFHEPSISD